ncbi:MAG: PIN domain-containing protein [Archaeoglobus sp.]|uniref:type II toxin-antitoxin system VapC family toxin n=1 Tax=Archaeoglobus sp. TaxID=1872626 RepID=UPI001DE099E3|nr:type II toxin-antitoxin system VapC family toxin [Archaeoglobus sp.]MBO8180825.1 PIN domain-containing protein [Archaeoglobus sp.]
MDDVFVDSSTFVTHCMAGDYTLVKLIEKHTLTTSPNVIEESFYKSLFLRTEAVFGKANKYTLKDKYLKHRKSYEVIFRYYYHFIGELVERGVLKVLPVTYDIINASIEISWKYGLLPNDALIAATCKHYGIKKIATFDDDFTRVDFLEVIGV